VSANPDWLATKPKKKPEALRVVRICTDDEEAPADVTRPQLLPFLAGSSTGLVLTRPPKRQQKPRVVNLLDKDEVTAKGAYARVWRSRPGNREKELAQARARKRYANNRERELARARQWVEDNPARARVIWRDSKKKRYHEDPALRERVKARVKAWKAAKRAAKLALVKAAG
jgi:hypothetical protein